jgi:hypothetical protein
VAGVSDYVRLPVQYNTSLRVMLHHVSLMLEHQLAPQERNALAQQRSVVGVLLMLKQLGFFVDDGRWTNPS